MKSGTQPKAFRIFGAITAHNTTPTKILKWWTFENSFLSWGQMAKRKTASYWINDDYHRGTAMAPRFYILDIKVSSQPWAHKIVADGTFALHLKQKSGNHISPNMRLVKEITLKQWKISISSNQSCLTASYVINWILYKVPF